MQPDVLKDKLTHDLHAFVGESVQRDGHRRWLGTNIEGGPQFYLRNSWIVWEDKSYKGVVLAECQNADPELIKWFLDLLTKTLPYEAVEVESVMTDWLAGHLVMNGWEIKNKDLISAHPGYYPPHLVKIVKRAA